jgi:AcrR family transcriptional regulator
MAERPGLNRELIVETALRLADEGGLDALTLRRVARELGVTPMALYRYVASKDDLLDAVGDEVLGLAELPGSGSSWQEQLRAVARSYRTLLTRHPAALELVMARTLVGPNALRVADAVLGILRRAGFEIEDAAAIYGQLARSLLALVSIETSARRRLEGVGAEERARAVRLQLEALPLDEFENVVAAAPYLAAPADWDRSFERGVDFLIAGVEALPRQEPR